MGTFATSWAAGDTIPASELNTISGAWTSYTPTVGGTGWALGNGTISGRYKKVGRIVVCTFSVTWGTTSTFGGSALTLTAPFTCNGTHAGDGVGYAKDIGVGDYLLRVAVPVGSSTIALACVSTSASYASTVSLTTNVPMTWVSGDQVVGSVRFEANS